MKEFLKTPYFGNTAGDYLMAVGVFLVGLFAVWVIKNVVLNRLREWSSKTKTQLDDFLISAVEKTLVPLLYLALFYLAVKSLDLNPSVDKIISAGGALVVTLAVVRFVMAVVRHMLLEVWAQKQSDPAAATRTVKGLLPVLSVIVWGIGVVFLLDNLGFKISAVVAGLGIGGVAIALASQAVLGDMFSYFAIMFDKPFEIDDFIIVGDFLGTVEHVGIKTTRIRSLGGEQLVFSNKDLTDSRIKNYKRMQTRRIVFQLGVTYDTSSEKLKKAVQIVKDVITRTPETKFDRCHFASYGDFNLVIETVYYVLSADYNKYMDTQQAINFGIKQAYEKEGIDFAFPTQTIHMAGAGASVAAGVK